MYTFEKGNIIYFQGKIHTAKIFFHPLRTSILILFIMCRLLPQWLCNININQLPYFSSTVSFTNNIYQDLVLLV